MAGPFEKGDQRAIQLSVGVAVLFGLAVAGGSFVGGSGTNASAVQAAPWAAVGALVGLVVATIVVVAIRAATQHRWTPPITHLLLVALIASAIGALLGASLTPSHLEVDDVSPLDEETIERRNQDLGDLDENAGGTVGPVDSDGDGEADLDTTGNPILGYDDDGDGVVDMFLQPCPTTTKEPEQRPGLVPIDFECDGEVDQWVPFAPTTILRGTPPPDFAPAPTIPRAEQEQRAADQSPSRGVGPLVKWAAIGLVVLAFGAALLAWTLDRRADANEREDDEPDSIEPGDTPDSPPTIDLSAPLEASLDPMLNDPDPRTAICAAYGRLLENLADAGLPRRPEEAPEEHMQRCMNVAGLPAQPVAELLYLFSLARFSAHPITEEHRVSAVNAMRSAIDNRSALV